MSLGRRQVLGLAASFMASGSLTRTAIAQTYPSRPITLIVPFPPGGSTDPAARVVAGAMAAKLGQPIVVENVGGAGGRIGVGRLARAAPDGYTIDVGQWDTHVLNGIAYQTNYDLQKDFTPIGLMTLNSMLLIARKGFPANDLKSTVEWMKAHPGEVTFASPSAGAQLAGLSLQKLAGVEFTFVPYRGSAPAMNDVLGGQVDLLALQAAGGIGQVRAGTVKALANLSAGRSAALPEIQSADESGLPGLYIAGWFGLFAPKNMPKDIVARLNGAMIQALAEPEVQQRLNGLGLDVAPREQQTSAGFAAFHQQEMEKWRPLITAAGIKFE